MGNSPSKKKYDIPASHYGGIFIKFDKNSFFPGETLTGNIYLNLQNVYPGTRLLLSFKGQEYARWLDPVSSSSTDSDGNSTSSTTYYPREQKEKIFKQEREVYNWGQGKGIPSGQYIFPFQFIIPQGLPGSFFFREVVTDVTAEIIYTVTAYLQPTSDSIPKLKSKMGIVIREHPPTAIQAKEATIHKNVTSCCCCDKGTLSIRTISEKDAYAPSEVVRLTAEVDNSRCSSSIANVKFYLLQKIHLKAGVYFKDIDIPIYKIDLGGMTPGQRCVGNEAKKVEIQLPPGQPGTAKEVDKTNKKDTKPNNPAEFISPTANGRIVRSEFTLKVACKTDAICMQPPSAELPIFVYAPVPVRMPDPVPPMNWQPQQIAPVSLAFNVDYYTPNAVMAGHPQPQGYAPSVNQAPYQNTNQPYQVPMGNNNMNESNQPRRI